MEQQPSTPDYLTHFKELKVGEKMKIPLSMLLPTTSDDGTPSKTTGPIEVYSLRKREESGEIITAIWIADGDHIYFNRSRIAKLEAKKSGTNFDSSKVFIEVRKVIPGPEHDIRHKFNAKEWFE